jgi:iron complex transport system permease protein
VRRTRLVLPALSVLLVVTSLFAASVGAVEISMAEILGMLGRAVGIGTASVTAAEHESVLLAIRLPRVVLGVLVGSSLGISGAAMQGLFRNPLVDPGLLGLSSGAALGAVGAIVLGARVAPGLPPALAQVLLPLAAFGGGFLAMLLVQRLGRIDGRTAVVTLLLAGIAVNALCGALTGLLTYSASDAQLRSITFWSLGSLGGATWRTVVTSLPFFAVALVVLPRFGRPLNALLLGEAEAGHLGFSIERTKRAVMLLVPLAVGTSVAAAGILGFVGLVVPHLLRLVAGPDHRVLLPGSALLGAALLLVADAVARTIVVPAELPLGIVTAGIGAPFFLGLLVRERRRLG